MSDNDDIEKQLTQDEHLENTSPPVGLYNDDNAANLVSKVSTSHDGAFIYLGNKKFLKEDLMGAFGGTLNPGWAAPSVHKFANPAPLGLSAFALTTFVLSLINAGAMGVSNDSIVVGLACFYGGFIQLLAGMWEMSVENTFGALALSSYGGFWMSFGAISIPWFNIAASYDDPVELQNAVGFYLLGWAIFTFMLTLCTMKSTLAFFSLFFLLAITFLLLAIADLGKSPNCKTAGGVIGVIVAFIAWYNAYAGLANKQNAYVTVQAVKLPVWGKKSI
ncbi:Ady2 protein [Martiniozyma asiatica (nom. inval.)]|nr:Ady2 protein [Martiniozyma asiatica]